MLQWVVLFAVLGFLAWIIDRKLFPKTGPLLTVEVRLVPASARGARIDVFLPLASARTRNAYHEQLGGGRVRIRPPDDAITLPNAAARTTIQLSYRDQDACRRGHWSVERITPNTSVTPIGDDPCLRGWLIVYSTAPSAEPIADAGVRREPRRRAH